MDRESLGAYWAFLVVPYAISTLALFGVYDWINDIVTGEQLRKAVRIDFLLLITFIYSMSIFVCYICFKNGNGAIKIASVICTLMNLLSVSGLIGLFMFDSAYLFWQLE